MILERAKLGAVIAKITEQWGYFEDDEQPPSRLQPSAWEVHSLAETTIYLMRLLDERGIPYAPPAFPYVGGLPATLRDLFGQDEKSRPPSGAPK